MKNKKAFTLAEDRLAYTTTQVPATSCPPLEGGHKASSP